MFERFMWPGFNIVPLGWDGNGAAEISLFATADEELLMHVLSAARQASLPGVCPVQEAVVALAVAGVEQRGAIFTKREVVEFILDLAGYNASRPLFELRLLEPSFGDGDFLLIVVERLLESWRAAGAPGDPGQVLAPCICGVELHAASFEGTKAKVNEQLVAARRCWDLASCIQGVMHNTRPKL